jgi:very-short-patch-repair endonuclease
MAEKVATSDLAVARIAARQHGVVTIAQLRTAALSDDAVLGRVRSGRLHRIHRGVYAVGHPGLSRYGRWMAAALTCEGAAVSHRSAAELWELLNPAEGPLDISVPGDAGRARRPGIRVHRRAALGQGAITRRHGIPVTRPAQTIADLRGTVSPWELRRAIRQAEISGLALGDIPVDRTRSDLERAFLRLCRRNRFPPPEVNVRVGHWTVDFLWRRSQLVVETDSYAYHRGRIAFQDDRARDLDLRRRGFDVIRVSERQLNDEPETVLDAVRQALALAS